MQNRDRPPVNFALAAVALAFSGALALSSGSGWAQRTAPSPAGSLTPHATPLALPAFRIASGQGRVLASSDMAGRVTVLNIWATWCGPCLRELPALDRLQQDLGDNVRVLAVSQDEAGDKAVRPYLARLGASPLEVHYDTKAELASSFRARVLPVTVVIDKNGRERARYVGELDWSAAAPVRFIRQLADD